MSVPPDFLKGFPPTTEMYSSEGVECEMIFLDGDLSQTRQMCSLKRWALAYRYLTVSFVVGYKLSIMVTLLSKTRSCSSSWAIEIGQGCDR